MAEAAGPAYLAPAVFRAMRADVELAPDLEVAWVGTWDAEKEQVTAARWLARGTATCVFFATGDAAPGQMLIHRHPGPAPLAPSEVDVQLAAKDSALGIGHMIVSQNLAWHLVLRAPGELGGGLWTTRSWSWGPFLLTYRRRR
jgi:hypothetical protein